MISDGITISSKYPSYNESASKIELLLYFAVYTKMILILKYRVRSF